MDANFVVFSLQEIFNVVQLKKGERLYAGGMCVDYFMKIYVTTALFVCFTRELSDFCCPECIDALTTVMNILCCIVVYSCIFYFYK
jgi:hypothetical protein